MPLHDNRFSAEDFTQMILVGVMLSNQELANSIDERYFSRGHFTAVEAIRHRDVGELRMWLKSLGIVVSGDRIIQGLLEFLKQRMVMRMVGEFCSIAPTQGLPEIRSRLASIMEVIDNGAHVQEQG